MNGNDKVQNEYEKFFEDIVDTIAYNECVVYGEELNELKNNTNGYPQFKCAQLWQRLIVSWDGKCYMCCEDGKEEYQVGDITKDNIHDIWVGPRLEQARKLHREGKWYMLDRCENCAYPYMGL